MNDPMSEATALRLIESMGALSDAINKNTETSKATGDKIDEIGDDIDVLAVKIDDLTDAVNRREAGL
tara:strand:+ start:377805 stop:378005 length:201 start_codon:yes stop_codon:yes gene_type:complete